MNQVNYARLQHVCNLQTDSASDEAYEVCDALVNVSAAHAYMPIILLLVKNLWIYYSAFPFYLSLRLPHTARKNTSTLCILQPRDINTECLKPMKHFAFSRYLSCIKKQLLHVHFPTTATFLLMHQPPMTEMPWRKAASMLDRLHFSFTRFLMFRKPMHGNMALVYERNIYQKIQTSKHSQ